MNQTVYGDYHKKVCPLLVIDSSTGIDRYNTDCIGPRCAWYDTNKERCAVLSIARGK